MLFPKHCCSLRFEYWPNIETFCFWETLLGYFGDEVRSQNSFGVSPYIRKNFLNINLSCIFDFDQFKGHFGFFWAVSGYFGIGVGSENYWYILSTFVFWVTQKSPHKSEKNHFLSIALSCVFISDQFKGHIGSCILSTFVFWVTQNSLHFQYWPNQGHLGLFGAIFGSFGVGVRSEMCIGVSS